MREHLVNFLDNFFGCGKSAAVFVTIKKGYVRDALEEKIRRILPGDGDVQMTLQGKYLCGEVSRLRIYPEDRGGFAAETAYLLTCGVF